MHKFCLATLNCNDRDTLFKTVSSLLKTITIENANTIYPWHIYMQGCSDEFINKFTIYTQEQQTIYPWIKFIIHTNKVNEGLSKGLNKVNDITLKYEYVLFIEDDWYCLPSRITGLTNNDWLTTCIEFMDNDPMTSTIALRRYHDDQEKFQYGWTRTIPYYCHKYKDNFNYAQKILDSNKEIIWKELRFKHVPRYLYTNNPCIRRNYDYYKAGLYPFQEYPDINTNRGTWTGNDSKDVPYWSWFEGMSMEKTIDLVTYYLDEGIFGHYEDWKQDLDE
jgi:hypothetical protein